MKIATMKCYRCPAIVTVVPNRKYCPTCRPIVKAEQNAAKSDRQTETRRQDREAKRTSDKARQAARIIITDEEQQRINREIDNKHNFQLLCRTLRPGDADFDKIAATVIPPAKIRNDNSSDRPVFYAEADPAKLYRRHESHSTARG